LKNTNKKSNPVVLVCPLSWGLGHASRCIPVVRKLLQKNCIVHIGGSEEVIAIMKGEFGQEVSYVSFGGMRVRYGKRTFFNLILQTPKFIFTSIFEHYKLRKVIKLIGANAVISDNRYGLWSKKVFTVFITHQLNIKLPSKFSFLQNLLSYVIKKIIRKHNALWIPDNRFEKKFAGELSEDGESFHLQTFYTGLLTRFSGTGFDNLITGGRESGKKIVLCIVSGPEPQRAFFEKSLICQLQQIPYDSVLLRGVPGNNNRVQKGRCIIYDHTDSHNFSRLISSASLIVCRPGYSSLMDLSAFGSKALLVPTPGQPEQEYLAELHKERRWCYSVNQDDLDLKTDIEVALSYDGVPELAGNDNNLNDAVDHMLKALGLSY